MNIDLINLSKYPEFYALKKELELSVNTFKEELSNLDVKDETFAFQAGIKIEAIKMLNQILINLGMVENQDSKTKRKTFE